DLPEEPAGTKDGTRCNVKGITSRKSYAAEQTKSNPRPEAKNVTDLALRHRSQMCEIEGYNRTECSGIDIVHKHIENRLHSLKIFSRLCRGSSFIDQVQFALKGSSFVFQRHRDCADLSVSQLGV